LRLPISFIVIRNGGYEALNEFGRYFRIPHIEGLQLPQLDFCALARGLGLAASSARSPAELNAALPAAFASSAPTLLEVIVEPQAA
jgi:benzoylformate decarboxylase